MMQDAVVRRHGGLGVTSFIIGLLSLIIDTGVIGVATSMSINGQQTQQTNMIVGGAILLTVGACLLGIGLGIAGAADRTSKKGFPVTGIILCVLVIVIIGALMAIGLRQGA